MQPAELREYCARRGWDMLLGSYVDAAVSGARERRPELDRMLTTCRRRQIDAVVVYRYDRFARSLRQLVNALYDFRALGIEFVSIHEGVDTSTPNGRLVFGIFPPLSPSSSASSSASACALVSPRPVPKGSGSGRPRRPVDTVRLLELRAQGWSWPAIAKEVGAGLGTIHRAAQRATGSNSWIQLC